MKKLNNKELLFLSFYKVHFDQTKAAREMGYKNPGVQATRIMARPHIKSAVKGLQRTIASKMEISAERLREEVAYNAFRKIGDIVDEDGYFYVNLRDLPDHIQRCIDGVEITQIFGKGGEIAGTKIKLKMVPKAESQKLLGIMIGALTPGEEQKRAVDSIWDAIYRMEAESNQNNIVEGKLALLEDQT